MDTSVESVESCNSEESEEIIQGSFDSDESEEEEIRKETEVSECSELSNSIESIKSEVESSKSIDSVESAENLDVSTESAEIANASVDSGVHSPLHFPLPVKKTRTAAHLRAGLIFSVARVHSQFRKSYRSSFRLSKSASVCTAAVMEYLVAEIFDAAGDIARERKRKRITPRHIQSAVQMDYELAEVFRDVIIPGGGVMPYIHPALL